MSHLMQTILWVGKVGNLLEKNFSSTRHLFFKKLRTSLILSVIHVSDSLLSLALEVCYVPIGDEE